MSFQPPNHGIAAELKLSVTKAIFFNAHEKLSALRLRDLVHQFSALCRTQTRYHHVRFTGLQSAMSGAAS